VVLKNTGEFGIDTASLMYEIGSLSGKSEPQLGNIAAHNPDLPDTVAPGESLEFRIFATAYEDEALYLVISV